MCRFSLEPHSCTPLDLDLCAFAFFSERLTTFYLTQMLFGTETALTYVVEKLCANYAGVCAATKVCVPGNVITNVSAWRQRGEKWSLQRTRIADELLYKREEQNLIVLSQNVSICPNSLRFEWSECIAVKNTSAPNEMDSDLGRLRQKLYHKKAQPVGGYCSPLKTW